MIINKSVYYNMVICDKNKMVIYAIDIKYQKIIYKSYEIINK